MKIIRFIFWCFVMMLLVSIPLSVVSWLGRSWYILVIGIPVMLGLVASYKIFGYLWRIDKPNFRGGA